MQAYKAMGHNEGLMQMEIWEWKGRKGKQCSINAFSF